MRSLLLSLLLPLAAACASVDRAVLVSAQERELAPELDCMSECLRDGTETCEDCAEICLDARRPVADNGDYLSRLTRSSSR